MLRFCHAENIYPLVTSLGIFKDAGALKGDNYENQASRLFKTATIAPFSANIAFVLFKCSHESKLTHKVQILINELPVGVIDSGRLACSRDDERLGRLKDSICDARDLIDLVLNNTKCHEGICVEDETFRFSNCFFIFICLALLPCFFKFSFYTIKTIFPAFYLKKMNSFK